MIVIRWWGWSPGKSLVPHTTTVATSSVGINHSTKQVFPGSSHHRCRANKKFLSKQSFKCLN
jgi:hypothetical protein